MPGDRILQRPDEVELLSRVRSGHAGFSRVVQADGARDREAASAISRRSGRIAHEDNHMNQIDARTVAMLARAPSTSLHDATVLIQQFADMVASEHVTKAIGETYSRALAILDAAIEMPL